MITILDNGLEYKIDKSGKLGNWLKEWKANQESLLQKYRRGYDLVPGLIGNNETDFEKQVPGLIQEELVELMDYKPWKLKDYYGFIKTGDSCYINFVDPKTDIALSKYFIFHSSDDIKISVRLPFHKLFEGEIIFKNARFCSSDCSSLLFHNWIEKMNEKGYPVKKEENYYACVQKKEIKCWAFAPYIQGMKLLFEVLTE